MGMSFLFVVIMFFFFFLNLAVRGSPRWQRYRRMWSSSAPTNTSRIHLHMEQFSQSTWWTPAEDPGHLKDKKDPHVTGPDKRKKRKGREEAGRNLSPWWGAGVEERLHHLGKPLYQQGDQIGQKGRCGVLEERSAIGQWQGGQRETYRRFVPQHCAPQSEMGVLGIGSVTWGLESTPKEDTASGYEETAWGDESEELWNQECLWRKPWPL